MPHICLLALIGLPAAGKTQLSNWLIKQQPQLDNWNILHLCYDNYLNHNFNYKEQRNNLLHRLSELIETLQVTPQQQLLQQYPKKTHNFLIVCDDNHYYQSMRYKLYQLCRSRGCLYAQLYIATPLNECLQRNAAREEEQKVPATIIEAMQQRLEVPLNEFWQRHQLTIENLNKPAIYEFLNNLLHCKVDEQLPPTNNVKQLQPPSATHQLDLLLRGRIQLLMQSAVKLTTSKSVRSRALNEQRKQILALFKQQQNCSSQHLEYYVNLLN